jgi:hypothetical protein
MWLANRNAHRPMHTSIGWFHATSDFVMHLLERLDPGSLITLTIRK